MARKKEGDEQGTTTMIVAQTVDKLYKLRQERLKIDKESAELKKEESALTSFLIDTLKGSGASTVGGKVARVTLVERSTPRLLDWDAFYKYVTKTKQFDLMAHRLSDAAVSERIESGVTIPGVELYEFNKLSVTKV